MEGREGAGHEPESEVSGVESTVCGKPRPVWESERLRSEVERGPVGPFERVARDAADMQVGRVVFGSPVVRRPFLEVPGQSRLEPLQGDPGDEDESVSRRRGVQVRVAVTVQFRSRFVPGSPVSADELAVRERVAALRSALQAELDAGRIEGFRIDSANFDVLPPGQ